MATKTPYLKMEKPELTDKVSPEQFNANFDLLDTKIQNIDKTAVFIDSWDPTTGVLKLKTITSS